MKTQGIEYPFWTFRYAGKKSLFEIIRVHKRGGNNNKAFFYDIRVPSLHYSLSPLRKIKNPKYITYSTLLKEYRDISELNDDYKEKLIQSVFVLGIE